MKKMGRLALVLCLTAAAAFGLASCGDKTEEMENLASNTGEVKEVVLFSPSARVVEEAEMTPVEVVTRFAESKIDGLKVVYTTYRAEDYTQATYDDVLLDRARSGMDDIYLMNPDDIVKLAKEDRLEDLSGLDSAKNLREVVKVANTIDGKLVAIPHEVVAYGIYVNKDLFAKYNLELPQTPEDLLSCCKVFKENGIEYPIGANRWWLECFVFTNGYDNLYLDGEDSSAKIADINAGKAKYSDYLRNGLEFLKQLIDEGYIDAETALTYEAIDGEGPAFRAGETPMVMAYWGAANRPNLYGELPFDMDVIGFPSRYGNIALVNCTGYGVIKDAAHKEVAMQALDLFVSDEALTQYEEFDPVISSSVNVDCDCPESLEPLYACINDNKYVLVTNANMQVEQWGNMCTIVQELMAGATVDECCARLDALQEEAAAQ